MGLRGNHSDKWRVEAAAHPIVLFQCGAAPDSADHSETYWA